MAGCQFCSKYGSRTGSICITWELVKKRTLRSHPGFLGGRGRTYPSVSLNVPPCDSDARSSLRSTIHLSFLPCLLWDKIVNLEEGWHCPQVNVTFLSLLCNKRKSVLRVKCTSAFGRTTVLMRESRIQGHISSGLPLTLELYMYYMFITVNITNQIRYI